MQGIVRRELNENYPHPLAYQYCAAMLEDGNTDSIYILYLPTGNQPFVLLNQRAGDGGVLQKLDRNHINILLLILVNILVVSFITIITIINIIIIVIVIVIIISIVQPF